GAEWGGWGEVGGGGGIRGGGMEEIYLAGFDGTVGGRRDAVMDNGAVGPGARDRVEAEVAEAVVLAPERRQPFGGLDLRQPAVDGVLGEPGQEPGHGGAVAPMGGARTLALAPILP